MVIKNIPVRVKSPESRPLAERRHGMAGSLPLPLREKGPDTLYEPGPFPLPKKSL
jgi:hypothetical protein